MSETCSSCGVSLKPNAKFCTSCGAATFVAAPISSTLHPPSWDQDAAATSRAIPVIFDRPALVVGGLIALALVIGAIIFLATRSSSSALACDPVSAASDPACAEANAPAIGTPVTMYVAADANVRPTPTAIGTAIIRQVPRGTPVSGILQPGTTDPSKLWLKLDDNSGSGFISAVNLSTVPRRPLAEKLDYYWAMPSDIQLQAEPEPGAALREIATAGTRYYVSGVTDNGFTEVKLKNGGVRYFPRVDEGGGADVAVAALKASSVAAPSSNTRMDERDMVRGVIGDQAIAAYTPPGSDDFTRIFYRNIRTGKACSAHLERDHVGYLPPMENKYDVSESVYYRQVALSNDVPCSKRLMIHFEYAMQAWSASWQENDEIVMQGILTPQ